MLSKKAKELLSRESKTKRSLKFQLGGSPTVDINPTFNPLESMDNSGYGFNNSNYQMDLNQPLNQNLSSAQNYNYIQLQNNVQKPNPQNINPQNTVQQPQGDWQDYTGALGKIGFGVKSFVEGIQERNKAKTYQRVSKQENDRRLENQRQTGYVLTPYTNKRTWSMKKGGLYIPMPSPGTYQEGGQIDPKAVKSFDKEKLKAVQLDLKSKGLYKGKVDGIYGPLTNAAIQGYNDKNAPWEETGPYKLTTSDNNPSLPHVTNRTEMQKELDSRGKTRGQDQQMLPDFMNKKLAENFYPVDYNKGTYSNPLFRTAAALSGEKDPLSPKTQKEKNDKNLSKRYDAWQMYLGQPQTNNSFKISKYSPNKAKSDKEEYYDFTDDVLKKHLIDQYAKSDFNTMVVPDWGDVNNTMGAYTIRKGKDNNGHYISYYDKWDLAGSNGVGKPFEILGRVYYDPKTGKQLPDPESQYQEGGLTFNPNLDSFMNSYQNSIEQQQLQNQMFQDHYDNANQQKKLKWKTLQSQGLQSFNQGYKTLQGAVKQAVMMQEGGLIDKYNTPLNTEEIQLYNKWRSKLPKRLQSIEDYDLQGFWKENPNFSLDAPDAHLTDKFKKPNHETFSLESQYAKGKNVAYAGAWDGDNYIKPMIKYGQSQFTKYQDGGELDPQPTPDTQDTPDTESLYSSDFESPIQHEDFAPEQSLKSGLESWIFQDEAPMPDTELAQRYSKSFGPLSSSDSVIDQIKKHESGGNPEAVNMIGATGYYQFTPQWADEIAGFMGLPKNTPKSQVMAAFAKNPQAQDAFMNHVVNNIYMPKIEQLRPLINKYGFTDDEMIKFLHYRGLNDTEKRLKTGDFEVSQEEKRKYKNPDILSYIKSK